MDQFLIMKYLLKIHFLNSIFLAGHAFHLHVWSFVNYRETVRDQVRAFGLHDVGQRVQPGSDDLLFTRIR
jgi:hypothetical protein